MSRDVQVGTGPADSIVDAIPGLVAVWTPEGETAYVNERVLVYFGTSLEDLQNWKQSDAVHPDDLPRVTAAWKHSISTGTIFRSEHRLRARDGEYHWFDVRARSGGSTRSSSGSHDEAKGRRP